jgi:hypothetical protein
LELDWVACPFCTTPVGQAVEAHPTPASAAYPAPIVEAPAGLFGPTAPERIPAPQPILAPVFETASE